MGCGSSVPVAPDAAVALASEVSFPEFKNLYLKFLVREASSSDQVVFCTHTHRFLHPRLCPCAPLPHGSRSGTAFGMRGMCEYASPRLEELRNKGRGRGD